MAAGRGKEAVERRKNTEGGGGRRVAWAGLCGLKKKTRKRKKKRRWAGLSPARKGKKEKKSKREREGRMGKKK